MLRGRFAFEEGIPRWNRAVVEQQFYSSRATDKLMEDHAEVVTHGGRAMEKELMMLLIAGLLAVREPVEFLPDDGGAVG